MLLLLLLLLLLVVVVVVVVVIMLIMMQLMPCTSTLPIPDVSCPFSATPLACAIEVIVLVQVLLAFRVGEKRVEI
jgi:hypothetical protein